VARPFDMLYIEKVLRLMGILEIFFYNDELADKYVLKGGTALNLFYFQMPRLSVDIDLNYLGLERETMLAKTISVREKQLGLELEYRFVESAWDFA
jgi:predicted nucleotidyltransferase component of viral defense system